MGPNLVGGELTGMEKHFLVTKLVSEFNEFAEKLMQENESSYQELSKSA